MKLTNEQKRDIRETVWLNTDAQITDSLLVLARDEMECTEENEARQAYAHEINRRVLNRGDVSR